MLPVILIHGMVSVHVQVVVQSPDGEVMLEWTHHPTTDSSLTSTLYRSEYELSGERVRLDSATLSLITIAELIQLRAATAGEGAAD